MRYGISDVALAKRCRKLQVPLPGRGYWAKKEYGHRVRTEPLPKLKVSARLDKVQYAATQSELMRTPSVEEDLRAEMQRIDQLASSGCFAFVDSGKGLRHPLVVRTRKALREGYQDDRHMLHPSRQEACLDLAVSKESTRRALRIAASTM